MDDPETAATTHRNDADQLYELVHTGGFWGLAPDWVPRGDYATPTRLLLNRVALRLLAESVPREGERWW